MNNISFLIPSMSTSLFNENITYSLDNKARISFKFPPGAGNIKLNPRNSCGDFGYQVPTIDSIGYSNNKIEIQGNNFFNEKKLINLSLQEPNMEPEIISADEMILVDHEKITFNRNIFSPQNLTFRLSIANRVAGSKTEIFRPIIAKINPGTIPTIGGKLTILGTYLNGDKNKPEIKIGDSICGSPIWASDGTNITCEMPKRSPNDKPFMPVIITINNIINNSTNNVSFEKPFITSLKQEKQWFNITGGNLGDPTIPTSYISFLFANGSEIDRLRKIPDKVTENQKNISTLLPSNACNGFLVVINGAQSNRVEVNIKPIITDVSMATTNGSIITVSGKYLNIFNCDEKKQNVTLESSDDKQFKCQFDTLDEKNKNGAHLYCQAPPGTGSNYSVKLTINNLPSDIFLFHYKAPIIHSTKQRGDSIVIIGEDFGEPLTLAYNRGKTARNFTTPAIVVVSNTELLFPIPQDLYSGYYNLIVANQETKGINQLKFGPIISSISRVPTSGGNVTIYGSLLDRISNFNITFVDNNPITDDIVCQTPFINGSKLITCVVQEGCGHSFTIVYKFDGDDSYDFNPDNITFSYEPPTILVYTLDENSILRVYGSNYNETMDISIKGNDERNKPLICTNVKLESVNQSSCYLPKFPHDFIAEPNENITIVVNVGGQVALEKIFIFDPSQREPPPADTKIKVIVPAIVIPCFLALVCGIVVSIILIQRHKKMKKLRKLFNN
ncbi:hypothetical protein CYY_002134 [Polysphondylium violaceum]|uniref:IPT/TIG domain-containing protein n=1 Tax=Polysphondylium violaceum TaxID=133409 RepID=A0A8J4PYM3_9MYCE|nr:hypothetical protein CYY_002134 [Polysphondylium violaceum]